MKRLHVHVGVESIEKSIGFYSALFGAEPTTVKHDYAKWLLEDPRVNFAISLRDGETGLAHLGLQVDESDELDHLRVRLAETRQPLSHEGKTECCYAQSDKSWVEDPSGIAWEAFVTMGEVDSPSVRVGAPPRRPAAAAEGCCKP